jgi:glutamate synthase (NADPH/NADH) small chain
VGKVTGFLEYPREGPRYRPVPIRLRDWHEVYEPQSDLEIATQGARCMDCGIPFCMQGCPLGNLIPTFNDAVYRLRWAEGASELFRTNNFPEFTGRLCPAPCESACVLGISSDPVTIERVEYEVVEHAFANGFAVSSTTPNETGRRVAVVGSGPAGLAAAAQLRSVGHGVDVYERSDAIGGLLRYGIPEFKMEKSVLDRRLAQMRAEGTVFRTHVSVGADAGEVAGASAPGGTVVPAAEVRYEFDALVLATGSTRPRDLEVPGRQLDGVHYAMEFLKPSNQVCEGALQASPITAAGKHVVIIGGGDTGADCLGTVHRQGAASVHQLEILPSPPAVRGADNPWPTWPLIFRTSSAHEEGGERIFAVTTVELLGDGEGVGVGHVRALRLQQVSSEVVDGRPQFLPVAGTETELEADLVLLAMGFSGPERLGVVAELGLELDARGNVAVGKGFATSVDGVFACGDMARGQSLIVWAIAEGRAAAAEVDRFLMGTTSLPRPIVAGQLALR